MNTESFDQTPEGYKLAIDEHKNKITEHKSRKRNLEYSASQRELSDEEKKLLKDISQDIVKRQKEIERLQYKLENNT